MPTIRFDQGDTGTVDRSRSDIALSVAVSCVAGSVVGTAVFALLDRPAGSSAALTGTGLTRAITPDVAGSYRVRAVDDNDDSYVIHTFTVLTPLRAVHIPAHNERADEAANDAENDAGSIASSETNEGGGFKGWHVAMEDLARKVELSDPNLNRSTGVLDGGLLSAGAGAGEFSASDGSGIVMSYAVPTSPVGTPVAWTGLTDIAVTAIATTQVTFLLITTAGVVLQVSGTSPTEAQFRGNIYLGYVTHPDHISISDIVSTPHLAYGAGQDFRTFTDSFDPVQLSGVAVSGVAATLSIQHSAGQLFAEGINFHNDKSNPSIAPVSAANPITFDRIYSDGTPGGETLYESSNVTFLDPLNYALAGVLTAVPGTSSRATAQRLYVSPAGQFFVAYGETFYTSLSNARALAASEAYVESALMRVSSLLGFWAVTANCSDTTDPSQSRWMPTLNQHGVGSLPEQDSLASFHAGTGWLSGGVVSQASASTVDITAGTGRIVDYSDPANPIITDVPIPASTGLTVTDVLTTTDVTMFAYDVVGSLTQIKLSTATAETYRNYVIVGRVGHIPTTGIITVNTAPGANAYDGWGTLQDLLKALGPMTLAGANVFGNVAGDLTIDHDSGTLFIANRSTRTTPKTPDMVPVASGSAVNILRAYRGLSGSALIDAGSATDIDPSQWDDGSGTLQAVASNDWSVQHIFLNGTTVVVGFGQSTYNSKSLAVDAITSDPFEEQSPLPDSAHRSYLVVREGATDLTDIAEAEFIEAPKFRIFGQSGGGVASTGSWVSLSDTPSTLVAQGGKLSVVNSGGTALELVSDIAVDTIAVADTVTYTAVAQTASAATLVVDLSAGHVHNITLGINVTTVTLTPPPGAGTFVLRFIQDGTGTRTLVGWPAAVNWPSGTAPTFGDIAAARRIVTLVYDGTSEYEGESNPAVYS